MAWVACACLVVVAGGPFGVAPPGRSSPRGGARGRTPPPFLRTRGRPFFFGEGTPRPPGPRLRKRRAGRRIRRDRKRPRGSARSHALDPFGRRGRGGFPTRITRAREGATTRRPECDQLRRGPAHGHRRH